jgi:hypothetical protein
MGCHCVARDNALEARRRFLRCLVHKVQERHRRSGRAQSIQQPLLFQTLLASNQKWGILRRRLFKKVLNMVLYMVVFFSWTEWLMTRHAVIMLVNPRINPRINPRGAVAGSVVNSSPTTNFQRTREKSAGLVRNARQRVEHREKTTHKTYIITKSRPD